MASLRGTHCRAAKIICALRSRKLASRFSALSSHTATPPTSSGAITEMPDAAAARSCRLYRVMRLSPLGFAPLVIAFTEFSGRLADAGAGSIARG